MENDTFWGLKFGKGHSGESDSTPPPGLLHSRQEPITRQERATSMHFVKAFSRASLFLERFWREF